VAAVGQLMWTPAGAVVEAAAIRPLIGTIRMVSGRSRRSLQMLVTVRSLVCSQRDRHFQLAHQELER
jgi:hypothetical protein